MHIFRFFVFYISLQGKWEKVANKFEKSSKNKFEKSSKFLSPPQADGVLRNFAPTGTDFS